jgi:hypothetical protein
MLRNNNAIPLEGDFDDQNDDNMFSNKRKSAEIYRNFLMIK